MPMVKVDFMIARIENLGVPEHVPDGAIACLMSVVSIEGVHAKIGLSREALETLTAALIEKSPRTPGTPGRN